MSADNSPDVLNDRQKSTIRFLAGKIGGRFDRRAMIDLTDLSGAEYEHIVSVLMHAGCIKILADQSNVTSGQIQILPLIQRFAQRMDEPTSARQPASQPTLDVLISWSKSKSRNVAAAIYDWLPKVLPGIKPWMSDRDIDKGKEWFGELHSLLAGAKLCIVCVTDENVRSPWLYYETGAIAAKQGGVWVCPYIVGVKASILSDGPLGRFQCTESTESDTLSLVKSLNEALATVHNEDLIAGNFAGHWPALEQKIRDIKAEPIRERAEFIQSEVDEIAGFSLASEARTILLEASRGDGRVTRTRSLAGTSVCANGKELNEEGNPRSEALWEQAINVLADNRFLDPVGTAGSLFRLTAGGYKVADKLKDRQS